MPQGNQTKEMSLILFFRGSVIRLSNTDQLNKGEMTHNFIFGISNRLNFCANQNWKRLSLFLSPPMILQTRRKNCQEISYCGTLNLFFSCSKTDVDLNITQAERRSVQTRSRIKLAQCWLNRRADMISVPNIRYYGHWGFMEIINK